MTRPDGIPPPDRHQLENLNTLYAITATQAEAGGVRGRAKGLLFRLLARFLNRQQHFNAALVDHINRVVDLGALIATTQSSAGHGQDVAVQQRIELTEDRPDATGMEQLLDEVLA